MSRDYYFSMEKECRPCLVALALTLLVSSCAGGLDPQEMVGRSVDEMWRVYGEGVRYDARPFDSSMDRYGYVEGVNVLWFYSDNATRSITAWMRTSILASFPDPASLVGLGERALTSRIGLPSYVIETEDSKTLFYNTARHDGALGGFVLDGSTRIVYMERGIVVMAGSRVPGD